MTTTCRCTRPVTDGYACHVCADEAAKHLRTIAGLAPHLDDKRAGVRGIDYSQMSGSSGARLSESPMPVDLRVSRVADPIRAALVRVALSIESQATSFPEDTISAIAPWLAEHVDLIRTQPDACEDFMSFETCASNLIHLFDRPPDQLYLGTCAASEDDETACVEPVYVESKAIVRAGREVHEGAAAVVSCPRCKASIDVVERRQMAREALASYQATMVELVRLSALVQVSRSGLYRAVATGALVPVGWRQERNLRGEWRRVQTFSIGDAMALATRRERSA